MCVPGVVGPALDDHVACSQSSFAAFEDERCFSLQKADDVDRMGLMHSWVARLIDDVTSAVKCSKSFARGLFEPVGAGINDARIKTRADSFTGGQFASKLAQKLCRD